MAEGAHEEKAIFGESHPIVLIPLFLHVRFFPAIRKWCRNACDLECAN